jgi:hypothetical protein
MTGAEEALGSSGQASELGTGQSTGFAWARQPRGDCSLHRNAGKQTGVMKAETVGARKTVELAFNVALLSCSPVEL